MAVETTRPLPAASMRRARNPAGVRFAVWLLHMALPLLGLWLVLGVPELDARWEHHQGHFWLVLGVAAVNVGLAVQMSEATRRRADLRLFLVSLAFLSSAGFLFLHAIATPGVLVEDSNAGFTVASQVGLFLAGAFGLASAVEFSPARAAALMRHQNWLRGGLLALFVAWAAISLAELPPLDRPLTEQASAAALRWLAFGGITLFGAAALGYFRLYRRRPAVMLLSVLTAFTVLAEAMVAIALARNWQISWWEWHALMAFGFGFVAYSAYVRYRVEGGASGLFRGIYLAETVAQIEGEYRTALETVVESLQAGGNGQNPRVALADRFGLTEGQLDVLRQAAETVGRERDENRRLAALVAVGHEARVILDEHELLRKAVSITRTALAPDVVRVGVLGEGVLHFPPDLGGLEVDSGEQHADAAEVLRTLAASEITDDTATTLLLPLTVKGHAAGVLEVRRRHGKFAESDRWVLESLASQLSSAVENARLYRELDGLFRQYMSPKVATALLADPAQARLGGTVAEVTVLFADLRGFTPFSERNTPADVVALLNRYFGLAVPCVLAEGGTVVQFVGDAIMALFNAPVPQPDHAIRAARAALAMQREIETVTAGEADLPRFRVGINTGPALVGNIGSTEMRNFTAIGDTVNLAARLEASAEVGRVVIGEATYLILGGQAIVTPLGEMQLKGKSLPVPAFELHGLVS